jgi:hypothetical protein
MRDDEFRLLGAATVLEPPRDGTMLDGRGGCGTPATGS